MCLEVFIRRANLIIRSESLSTTDLERLNTRILRRARIYDTVIELIMNLVGVESRWSGFDEETIEEAITILTNALNEWEDIERIELGSPNVLLATIELNVKEMLKVNKGKSLVAEMARKIMNSIDMDAVAKVLF